MNHYSVAQLINSIFMLILGIIVLVKGMSRQSNRLFAYHSFALSFWCFAFFKMTVAATPENGLFWARWLHLGAVFIPVFFLHFTLTIVGQDKKQFWLIKSAYILCFLLLIILPTPHFVSHTYETAGIKYFVGPAGLQYHVFTVFFAFCIIYSFIMFLQARAYTRELKKTQLNYLTFAFLVGYIGGPCAFLPLFGIPIPKFSLYALSVYGMIITYSIVRYRLFDAEAIIRRTTFNVIVLFITFAFIMLVEHLYAFVAKQPVDIPHALSMMAGAFLLVVIILNINSRLKKLTDRIINTEQLKRYEKLGHLSEIIKKSYDKDRLFDSLTTHLKMILDTPGVDYYLLDEKTLVFHNSANQPEQAEIASDHIIARMLAEERSVLETDKIKFRNQARHHRRSDKLIDELQKLNAGLIIPFFAEEHLIGFLVIGHPENRIGYTEKEIVLLQTLAAQVSVILENFNLNEKIIHENRLELIGTMASSFAHEIRNPLTSVSTYLGMLPDKMDNKKFMDLFFSIVPREVERVANLTSDLLNFAKSAQSNPVIVDTKILVKRVLDLVKNEVEKKQLKVTILDEADTKTYADENQLYQVILNIMINAIHASDKGAVINIYLNNNNGQHTEISIEDFGKGIEQENLNKIFEPFYSTKIYGTGLGLATCKRIIESHGGTILAESETGKGTKFVIIIPRAGAAGA